MLLSLYLVAMKEILEKCQAGGIVKYDIKMWFQPYENNVAILKEMMKGLERYLDLEELPLSIEKTKIVIISEARSRKKKEKWKCKNGKREQEKTFWYLGYTFHKKNKNIKHAEENL